MNEPMIFQNPEFGKVRAIELDGEPWFVATDVATALGYQNAKDTVSKHCKYAKIIKVCGTHTLTDSPRGLRIIPEADVYALIFGSKLPKAEAFKDWVFTEVLPTIRKTGKYAPKEVREPTLLEVCEAYVKKAHEAEALGRKVVEIAKQRDEIGNNFGAGPDYYKVSEIPWLYKIFKHGYESHLHKRIGQMLSAICKQHNITPKKCQHENGGHWWRAYPEQAIDLLHRQLLADPCILSKLRVSRRRSVPGKCINFHR